MPSPPTVAQLRREMRKSMAEHKAWTQQADEQFAAAKKASDEQFAAMQKHIDERFAKTEDWQRKADEQFVRIDARFAAVDARFDAVDARFDAMEKRFDERLQAMMKALIDEMHRISAGAVRAIEESFRGQIVAVDDKYRDLPARVAALESDR